MVKTKLYLLIILLATMLAASPTPTPQRVVVIDAGHGGSETGGAHYDAKLKKYDLVEKRLNLAVAQRLKRRLEAAGYKVILTRNRDALVNTPKLDRNGDKVLDVDDDLQARVDAANAAKADIFVSIHFDSRTYDPAANYTTVYYCADRAFAAASHKLATSLSAAFAAEWQRQGWVIPNAGVQPDDVLKKPGGHLYLLGPKNARITRASQMPGALAEPMFLTNDAAAALLHQPATLDALANAYFVGIEGYFSEK